jgi:uncharacterized protein involved in exopolysaccharide biosynthesis
MGEIIEVPGPLTAEEGLSLDALLRAFLRWRTLIVGLGLLGGLMAGAVALLSPRTYSSTATFIPQGSDASTSGLALAAGQLGIRVGGGGGTWGPPVYVEVLHSNALLAPIALDTVTVAEEGRRTTIADVLHVPANKNSLMRAESAVSAVAGVVSVSEIKSLGAVEVSVKTHWPSVSLALAQRLVSGVNQFNVERRRTQATAERQFVEVQAAEAQTTLRQAEDRLLTFLKGNRAVAGSPELAFERDRLQRDVSLRNQVYTSLLQNLEEARMREVRDTPVITIREPPRLPVMSDGRGTVQRVVLGGFVGVALGVLIGFLTETLVASEALGGSRLLNALSRIPRRTV